MRAAIFILILTASVTLPFDVSAALDTTAPAVGFASPTTTLINTPVTLSIPFSDAVGVVGCNLYVDNNNQGIMTLSGTTSGTATRVHTFLVAGPYRAWARCLDGAGNAGLGDAVTVTVNTPIQTTPATDTLAPSAPSNLVRTTSSSDTTPTFTWFPATDNVGVKTYEVKIDQGSYTAVGNVTSFTSAVVAAGTHTFSIRARDGAGNVGDDAVLSFTISAAPSTIYSEGPPFTLEAMVADARVIVQGNLGALLAQLGYPTTSSCQLAVAEATSRVDRLFGAIVQPTVRGAIIHFTSCGTRSTLHLGAGERLGVVNSYKAAFGRLPSATNQWFDVIKIANGRFPEETSASSESSAKIRFKSIWRRAPNMANQNDKAAVNIMAYGLRPLPRNVNSERAAILTYKAIFGRGPTSAVDWDAVRAIAYSGARR